MITRLHHLQKRILNKITKTFLDKPFLLIVIGSVQWRFWRLWPDELWKPFPFYMIPKTESNPLGIIHAQSYGYFIHEYFFWICIWFFCAITTSLRGMFLVIIFIELMDVIDFALRYSTGIVRVLGWYLEFTDIKILLYVIIGTAWNIKKSSSI